MTNFFSEFPVDGTPKCRVALGLSHAQNSLSKEP